jgi:hypothetical protein
VGISWFPPDKTYNIFSNLVTDASKYAWGAHLTPDVRQHIISVNYKNV